MVVVKQEDGFSTKQRENMRGWSQVFVATWCSVCFPSTQVQRNCCLTLCNFSIPEELEFQYRRVNELLLNILNQSRQDESIQRIAVHLCNALVCQVDNDHKEAVGKMGFVMVGMVPRHLLIFNPDYLNFLAAVHQTDPASEPTSPYHRRELVFQQH